MLNRILSSKEKIKTSNKRLCKVLPALILVLSLVLSLAGCSGDDIAETVYFAASAPEHIQIAEILVMPTYQATGTISYKKKAE